MRADQCVATLVVLRVCVRRDTRFAHHAAGMVVRPYGVVNDDGLQDSLRFACCFEQCVSCRLRILPRVTRDTEEHWLLVLRYL